MSGICAVWRKNNARRIADALASIQEGLSTVETERRGQETNPGIGVGVSARFGEQQIYRDDRVLLACDAELLNEKELAREADGRAEVPLEQRMAALYERFGSGFVERLRGAFSLILWDRRERRLLAAIDGFGIKRVAYYQDEKVLLVASRVDALAHTGDIDLSINPQVQEVEKAA